MLVTDDDMSRVIEILEDETGPAHRAAHEYLDSLTKTVLAELMGECNESSAVARETWARAQPRFKEHLERVGAQAKADYTHRQRVMAAQAKMEIWRSQGANNRALDRIR